MTLLEPLHKPRRRRRSRRPAAHDHTARTCWLMEAAVAATFGVAVDEMRSATRCRANVAFARQAAMYLAHVALGQSCSAVGRLFGRDRTTVAHACRLVEERRDDPSIDRLLTMLEGICTDLSRARLTSPEARP